MTIKKQLHEICRPSNDIYTYEYIQGSHLDPKVIYCEVSREVPRFLQANSGYYFKLGHGRFLLHPLQLIFHQ